MIYHQAPDCTFYLGDVRECLDALPAGSVQAVVTSPPYFGLRKYAGVEPVEWPDGSVSCLGLEPTPDLFIAHLLDVFRSVRRVLRDDGVCFVNLGDSYTGSGKGPTGENGIGDQKRRQGFVGPNENMDGYFRGRQENGGGRRNHGLAGKNLLLIPQRFAIAMQDDGWVVRSMIVWSKKSCMPESVTDRPTSAHEVIWMFTKRPTYYWDAEAVREQVTGNTHSRGPQYHKMDKTAEPGSGIRANSSWEEATWGQVSARNIRNVWLDPDDRGSDFWHLGPESFAGAHFATFPTAIPRRCILAATSEAGCCSVCGKPWEREITKPTGGTIGDSWHDHSDDQGKGNAKPTGGVIFKTYRRGQSLGFRPSCQCSAPAVPCVVLDPFGGSGTTQVVARELGRHSIYIDASREYAEMAIKRYASTPVALPMVRSMSDEAEQLSLDGAS